MNNLILAVLMFAAAPVFALDTTSDYSVGVGGYQIAEAIGAAKSCVQSTSTAVVGFYVARAGTLRVGFYMTSGGWGSTIYGQTFVNGVAQGALHSNSNPTYQYYSDDVPVSVGALIEVHCYFSGTASGFLTGAQLINSFPTGEFQAY